MSVFPNLGAVAASGSLRSIVGALLMIVLVAAVLMLLVCAITWAVASAHGNYQAATKSRTGLWVSVGAAVLAGAAVTWLNFLLGVGAAL
jgi:hypothetical protein